MGIYQETVGNKVFDAEEGSKLNEALPTCLLFTLFHALPQLALDPYHSGR